MKPACAARDLRKPPAAETGQPGSHREWHKLPVSPSLVVINPISTQYGPTCAIATPSIVWYGSMIRHHASRVLTDVATQPFSTVVAKTFEASKPHASLQERYLTAREGEDRPCGLQSALRQLSNKLNRVLMALCLPATDTRR